MKDIIKSFFMGLAAAAGFFLAISFTADAEDQAAAELQSFLEGVQYGAQQATLNKECGILDLYRKPVKGAM